MSFLENIVPSKPAQRAASLVALTAGGCGGLYFASTSGVLLSWGIPYVTPWQVLTASSYAINSAAISAGGRLDGGSSDTEDSDDQVDLPPTRYFSPAGWAFGIWGPIFMGEAALAAYQIVPFEAVALSAGWLSKLSPWLAAAFLSQSCWCYAFRAWARDSGFLWVAAGLLANTAACLGGAHQIVRGAMLAGKMTQFQYYAVHLPISLHFAWTSCASLVNLNNYVCVVPKFSDKAKLNISLASIAAAVGLAVGVTGKTGDSVYAGVVAWALTAIASESGWGKMKGKVDSWTIDTQTTAAKIGAAICAVTAIATPFVLRKV